MDDTSHPASGKALVAARALDFVEPGMRLGLGTGSTAKVFVDLLGARVRDGLDVVGVPTSERTQAQAAGLGIRLATLDDLPELDLTIDGADEFDPALRLVKGGGGALLREKIVAAASRRMVVIADAQKRVDRLGRFPLPVEVVPFGLGSTRLKMERLMRDLGLVPDLRLRQTEAGTVFTTDGGHVILDCHVGPIGDPERLAAALATIPGVVEHGLFIGLASVVVTERAGQAELIERQSPSS